MILDRLEPIERYEALMDAIERKERTMEGYVITDGTEYVDGIRDGSVVWISAATQASRDTWKSADAALEFIRENGIKDVYVMRVLRHQL